MDFLKMMRTKKLTTEYYKGTNLKPWNIQQAIKDRVNREAEIMETIPTPLPPKPLQIHKQKLSLVSIYAFAKQMTVHTMRELLP